MADQLGFHGCLAVAMIINLVIGGGDQARQPIGVPPELQVGPEGRGYRRRGCEKADRTKEQTWSLDFWVHPYVIYSHFTRYYLQFGGFSIVTIRNEKSGH
jgi:hypothetical protein